MMRTKATLHLTQPNMREALSVYLSEHVFRRRVLVTDVEVEHRSTAGATFHVEFEPDETDPDMVSLPQTPRPPSAPLRRPGAVEVLAR
jgi:hypothetical protein